MTSGAKASITRNDSISRSVAVNIFIGESESPIGDGIAVLDGASASIEGNTIQENGRFGLILDGPGTTVSLSENRIEKSKNFGLVAQNQAAMPELGMSTFAGNGDGDTTLVGPKEVWTERMLEALATG